MIKGDHVYNAVPIQKMCLEELGHTVHDASSPGADNRGVIRQAHNSLMSNEFQTDVMLVNFTDPLRFDYYDSDIDELRKNVHSLEAFHAYLNKLKLKDIQRYYQLSKSYCNSAPVLFIGGHNKITHNFVNTINEQNNTDILHCVLESSTDYFSKDFCGDISVDNVNENFSTIVDETWSEEIIDYLLAFADYSDNNQGYQSITYPDGGKHLNASCQIKVIDLLMCYIEEHLPDLLT